jgi:hypothetical protein
MSLGRLRNDPCPCGSRKKYKKCHWFGEYMESLLKLPKFSMPNRFLRRHPPKDKNAEQT